MKRPSVLLGMSHGLSALLMAARKAAWMATLLVAANAGIAAPPSITLAVWQVLPAEKAALAQAIASFTQATGIQVKTQVIADKYMDVIRSRFAGRITPDVFYLDSHEAPILIRSGVLVPLDAHVGVPNDFYPQFLEAFRGENRKLYGLPKDYSTLALYINTALLKQAGFSLADVPTDQVALMDFARRLQAKLPRGVAAMILEKDLARHLAAIESYGTALIDAKGDARLVGNAGAVTYLQAFVDGRKGGYVLSPKDDLGADSPGAAFGAGKTVMMMEGNWVLSALRKDYADIAFVTREMPRINGRPNTMAFVVGYAVPRFAKNPEGGIRFAQFMTRGAMKEWSRGSGTLPSRSGVQAELGATQDAALAAHIAGARYATVWSRGTSLPVVNTNFGNQFQAALNGSISVAEALRRAEQASNREIERQR